MSRMVPLRFLLVLACAVAGAAFATPAAAVSCSAVNVAAPTFGIADLLSGGPIDASGSLSITCTGSGNEKNINVVACPNINAGTGNGGAAGPQRYLKSGNSQVRFNLYQDAFTTIWSGSGDMGGIAPRIVVALDGNGNGTVSNLPLNATLAASQNTAVTGTYTSNFTVDVRSAIDTAQQCSSVVTNPTSTIFTVAATYVANCIVATSDLNFGTIGRLSSAVDAETSMALTCSNGSSYTVALNGGSQNVADPSQRRLSRAGVDVIYGLYRDAARSQPWGASGGTMVGSTGTGNAVPISVFGRIPIQALPPPGLYQDTIIATVTY